MPGAPATHVAAVWPLTGPARGGTRVWILTSRGRRSATDVTISIRTQIARRGGGASKSGNRAALTFFDEIGAINCTYHTTDLASAVMPALPSHIRLPAHARLWVGLQSKRRLMQHLYTTPGQNSFVYLSEESLRIRGRTLLRSCIAECTQFPPALMDIHAGLLPPTGVQPASEAKWRQGGRVGLRAVPPGSSCEDWSQLQSVSMADCKRLGSYGRRWLGVRRDGGRFVGCVLTRRGGAVSVSFNVGGNVKVNRIGCHEHAAGGNCLCAGPLPMPRRPTLITSLMADMQAFGSPPNTRRCDLERDASARWLPMRGYHELEGPGSEARPKAGRWNAARLPSFTKETVADSWQAPSKSGGDDLRIDVVVAMHSTPVSSMVRAVLGAMPLGAVSVRVLVYHKGPSLDKSERDAIQAAVDEAETKVASGGRGRRVALEVTANLPNTGRCDHSYMLHLVRHWDHLADVTLFVKDTAMAHVHLGTGGRVLSFVRRLPDPSLHFWCARPMWRAPCWFEAYKYQSEQCRSSLGALQRGDVHMSTRCYANETARLIRASVRPLGRWLAHNAIGDEDREALRNCKEPSASEPARAKQQPLVTFCPGAIFAASRQAIRASPLETYKRLLASLAVGDNLEEGHYVERAWLTLFGGRSWRYVRASLAVYTVVPSAEASSSPSATDDERSRKEKAVRLAPLQAPCNRSALTSRWPAALTCICLSDSSAVLKVAGSRGWKTAKIASAEDALRLKLHPHASSALRSYDFTAFVDSRATLNVPAALEAISRYLTDSGASVLLDQPRARGNGRKRKAEAPSTEVQPARVILRRMSAVAGAVGEAWLGEASGSGSGSGAGAVSRAVLSERMLARFGKSVLLPPTLPRLTTSAETLRDWWTWWVCRKEDRCCKPREPSPRARAAAGGS